MSTRSQRFTIDGTFVVPAGITSVFVTMTAAGGGGGPGRSTHFGGGGGGGAGEYCVHREVLVIPTSFISVVIGVGGGGGIFNVTFYGTNGGASLFGSYIRCEGGYGGQGADVIGLGSPGKGGGCAGGYIGMVPNGIAAVQGGIEGSCFFGGASGAGCPISVVPYLHGAPCGPYLGGIQYPPFDGPFGPNTMIGGAGGGASMFGPGGDGGNSNGGQGYDAPTTSYGAGGGGASSGNPSAQPRIGGTGANGFCLVEWVE